MNLLVHIVFLLLISTFATSVAWSQAGGNDWPDWPDVINGVRHH